MSDPVLAGGARRTADPVLAVSGLRIGFGALKAETGTAVVLMIHDLGMPR